MNDSQQPRLDDVDVTSRPGTPVAARRSRSGASALGVVGAVVVALLAGPAVASSLASGGAGSPQTYSDLSLVGEQQQAVPVPTTPPVHTTPPGNANGHEDRTLPSLAPPAPTGQSTNGHEDRTYEPACP